jgi:exonuclease III
LRLNSDKQQHAVMDIEKHFEMASYYFYHNSTISSRGVGIVISKKLNTIVSERDIIRDPECNFILKKIQIKGIRITIGSIYGPNHNDIAFYDNLYYNLNGSENILIGGDFNCTWDPRQSIENLDTLNMV